MARGLCLFHRARVALVKGTLGLPARALSAYIVRVRNSAFIVPANPTLREMVALRLFRRWAGTPTSAWKVLDPNSNGTSVEFRVDRLRCTLVFYHRQ